jgi:hypothetical protein
MAYTTRNVSRIYVNIQRNKHGSLGKMPAGTGMVTQFGTIIGFGTRDGLPILNDGNRYLGEQLYITEAQAISSGWPAAVGCAPIGGHFASGNFIYFK